MAATLALAVAASFLIGRYPVPPHQALAILAAQLFPITPFWPHQAETVVLAIRLPRILAAMAIGAALSGAGAAFQGVFRNPMVSPDVLGVAAGAAFGAALAILLGGNTLTVQGLAFGCGLAAVATSYGIGLWHRHGGILIMILAGLIVGTVFSAGISLIKYLADPDNALPAITFWLMGSLASIQMRDLGLAAPPIALGLTVLIVLRWRLNILSFGDDEARALGVDASRIRVVTVIAATLVTAAAVAVGGVIGLVGLVVPHLARLLVGPNYRTLMPASIVLGAAFLLMVDNLARSLASSEIPLGILTSLIGAPFFLGLLINARKGWA